MSDVLDREELMELIDGDLELLSDMLESYDEEARDKLHDLELALTDQKAEEAATHAHTIKGMLWAFAAQKAGSTALQLELEAKSGDVAKANQLLPELKSNMDEARAALSNLLNNE